MFSIFLYINYDNPTSDILGLIKFIERSFFPFP